MRHGYGTYRQQVVKNIGAVASEMGNTIRVCERHYVNAFCDEDEAKEWFALVPQAPSNVIELGDARVDAAHLDDAINKRR